MAMKLPVRLATVDTAPDASSSTVCGVCVCTVDAHMLQQHKDDDISCVAFDSKVFDAEHERVRAVVRHFTCVRL